MNQDPTAVRAPSQTYNVDLTREVLLEREGVQILATRDRMGAFVKLDPELGPLLSTEEVLEVLKEAQIVGGLRPDRVQAIFTQNRFGTEQLVAWGKPPKLGEPGRLEYVLGVDKPAVAASVEAEKLQRVDYRAHGQTVSVKKGTLLVRRVPPVPGVPGNNVLGQPVNPPAVRDVKLPKGKNTEMDAEGIHLYAGIDGQVSQAGGLVHMAPVMEVRGDVDFSVGNVDFHGSINVGGNVLVDFDVKAQDNILIAGVVEGARVVAGGDIKIARGVQGAGKAKLSAGGSLAANFLNSADVTAHEVVINGPILHSQVHAEDKITTTGSNGTIAGGKATARFLIDCNALGTEMGVRTDVEVGIAPELREKLNHLHQEMRKVETQLARITPVIAQLTAAQEELGDAFPEEHAKSLAGAVHTEGVWRQQLARLEEQRHAIQEEDEKHRRAEILVRGEVFPGVHIKIYDAVLVVKNALKCLRFVRGNDGEITALPLS